MNVEQIQLSSTQKNIFVQVSTIVRRLISKMGMMWSRPEKMRPLEPYEIRDRKRVAKLIDYYKGNQIDYLRMLINMQFSDDGFKAKLLAQPNIRNIVKFLADTVPFTFREGVLIQAGNETDQLILNDILDDNHFDNFCREIDRMTWLCKTFFVKVDNLPTGQIRFRPITPEHVEVETDDYDPSKMTEFTYPRYPIEDNITTWGYDFEVKPKGIYCYWDEHNFLYTNERGDALPNPENPDNINPYGIIPVAVFREREVGDTFWQWPEEDIINAQDNLNVKLTFRNWLYKMFNIPQAVMIGPAQILNGQTISMDGSQILHIVTESLDNSGNSGISFDFKTPHTETANVLAVLNEEIRAIFISQGIDPNLFMTVADRQSGTSIALMNAKLEERRAISKLSLQYTIEEMFDIVRIVWNTHNPDNKLSDDPITVLIPEPKTFYATAADKWVDYTNKLKINMLTPADIMLLERNDLSNKAEAQKIIDANTQTNKAAGTAGLIQGLLTSAKSTVPPEPTSTSLTGA